MDDIANKSVRDVYPLHWLKGAALQQDEITLTINDVRIEYREGIAKAVLGFDEIVARWMLNATNAQSIADLFGEHFSDWIGHKICIYKISIPYETRYVTALRIREAESEGSSKGDR